MVNMHTSCHYAVLCYALKRAVSELSFLAKPCLPNVHDDQMILVAPLKGDKLDTPTIHVHPLHGLDQGPAHDHGHNYNHSPDSHGLGCHDPDFRPQHFMHVGLLQHYLAK